MGNDEPGAAAPAATQTLRSISEAVLAISSELDLERVLHAVVDAARHLIGSRYAALAVIHPGTSHLTHFIVSGVSEDLSRTMPWPRGLGLLGVLLRERRPLRVSDISCDPRSIGFPPGHPQMKSFLGVPVRLANRILGNFYLADKLDAEEFSQQDEDLLVLFALHAATALENARRFGETRQRLDETLADLQRTEAQAKLLLDLTLLMPSGPFIEEVPLEQVASRITELLGDVCSLILLDEQGTELRRKIVTHHSSPARAVAASRLLDSAWPLLLDHVVRQRRALFTADLDAADEEGEVEDGKALDPSFLRREKFSAAIALPIRTERKVFGILFTLASQPRTFSTLELDFARLLAERLGLALENVLLVRELKAALRERDAFISIATHELKTPIATILSSAELLSHLAEPDKELHMVKVIRRQAGYLARLSSQLLDVTRLQAGRLELERAPCDLVLLAREVIQRFALELGREARHRLRLVTGVPALVGRWDADRLEQVLVNLVGNAIKYSPEGGEVVVELARDGEQALVAVQDQGIGIPLEQQPRIFEAFQRGRNATLLRIEGTGLGLLISREIVERHGGTIGFVSEPGQGTRFFFRLPLAPPGGEPAGAAG